jgi:hypothetical protein
MVLAVGGVVGTGCYYLQSVVFMYRRSFPVVIDISIFGLAKAS